jgi:hypothetical protein
MSNLVSVEVGWALWGKRAGSNDDYSVLSCSAEPFSKAEFAAILSRFATGSPSVRQQGPGKLPWITLSWVGTEKDLHLGLSIQEATQEVDGAGRPITKMSYFCVPFAALRREPIAYASIYEEVADLELPRTGGDKLQLNVQVLGTAQMARWLAKFDEDVVATTASMLLRGPVSILQAEASTLAERLEFLDVVAAMLPYGYRAKYTAATWSDSGVRHRMRLAFAERPREDAFRVLWRQPVDTSAGGPARRYLRELNRVRGDTDDSGPAIALVNVMDHLSHCTEPQKFDDSQYAIRSVRQLDLPFAALADAKRDRADPAEVREVFEDSSVTRLEAEGRRKLLGELVSYGDPADLPTLRQWWEDLAADESQEILCVLIKTCRRMLWAQSPADNASHELQSYIEMAGRSGQADEVLAALIKLPAKSVSVPALAYAATLLNYTLFGAGRPGRGSRSAEVLAKDHPKTTEALSGSVTVACEFAVQLAGSGKDAWPSITWLCGLVPALAPFDAVITESAHALAAASFTRLSACGANCVSALLRAAAAADRLDRVLPTFTEWLSWRRDMQPDERADWRSELIRLNPATAQAQAYADLALLALDFFPHWLLRPAADADWRTYLEFFVGGWTLLRLRPDIGPGQRITEVLRQYLEKSSWPSSPAQAKGVSDLTRRITGSYYHSELTLFVANIVRLFSDARDYQPTKKWLATIDGADPDFVGRGAIYSLPRLPPGLDIHLLALICARAFHIGTNAAEAGRWAALAPALNTIQEQPDSLRGVTESNPGGTDILRELRACYVAGPSPEVLSRLAAIPGLLDRPGALQRKRANLLAVFGRHPGRASAQTDSETKPPGELTKEEREYLERLRVWLHTFIVSALNSQPRRQGQQTNDPGERSAIGEPQ